MLRQSLANKTNFVKLKKQDAFCSFNALRQISLPRTGGRTVAATKIKVLNLVAFKPKYFCTFLALRFQTLCFGSAELD
jgi:hypothetical protein